MKGQELLLLTSPFSILDQSPGELLLDGGVGVGVGGGGGGGFVV